MEAGGVVLLVVSVACLAEEEEGDLWPKRR
jgi:hypothetical protein